MFKINLLYIESEINNIYQTNVMENAVRSKLNNVLEKYSKNLEETCKYILSRDYKTIVKILKEEERNFKNE